MKGGTEKQRKRVCPDYIHPDHLSQALHNSWQALKLGSTFFLFPVLHWQPFFKALVRSMLLEGFPISASGTHLPGWPYPFRQQWAWEGPFTLSKLF